MRFVDIHISGFGKFHNLSMQFEPGINVIYGRNEAGKSTLHTFLRAMLFGFDRRPGKSGKKALYESFEPWKEAESYKGSMRIEHEGAVYRIERDFGAAPDDLTIINEQTGKALSDPQGFLSEALNGLTETGYINTISIGQLKSATENGMIAELKKYIANINTTGSLNLNADAAIAFLEKEKEALLLRLKPEAAKDYAKVLSSVKNLEEELARPEHENKLAVYTNIHEQMKTGLSERSERRAELAAQIEKGRGVLSENHFTDEASIEAYSKEAKRLYADYNDAKARCKNLRAILLPVFSLILAAGAAALTAALLYPSVFGAEIQDFFVRTLGIGAGTSVIAGAVLCGIFLLLAALLFAARGKQKRRMEETGGKLSAILREQTGNETVGDEAMTLLSDRMQGFVTLVRAVEKHEAEKRALNEEIADLSEKQSSCTELIERQRKNQQYVEQKLTELHGYKAQAEELRRLVGENRRLKEEIDAVEIAGETLSALSGEIRDSMGTYLNAEASRLINGITGGIYQSMDVGRRLDIFLNTRDRMVPIEQVSSGTMDQIYLALRLAAVRLVEGENDVLPLLFDDSFVLYDDDRLRHALSFLAQYYKGQMLIFSCHRREEEVLRQQGTPYNLLRLTK